MKPRNAMRQVMRPRDKSPLSARTGRSLLQSLFRRAEKGDCLAAESLLRLIIAKSCREHERERETEAAA
jgi:hypothetical protein